MKWCPVITTHGAEVMVLNLY